MPHPRWPAGLGRGAVTADHVSPTMVRVSTPRSHLSFTLLCAPSCLATWVSFRVMREKNKGLSPRKQETPGFPPALANLSAVKKHGRCPAFLRGARLPVRAASRFRGCFPCLCLCCASGASRLCTRAERPLVRDGERWWRVCPRGKRAQCVGRRVAMIHAQRRSRRRAACTRWSTRWRPFRTPASA